MQIVEYIADALRFASQQSGLKDWSDFIIITHEYNNNFKDRICDIPVYIVPMKSIPSFNFTMAYLWDIDIIRIKALHAILEYQELYKYND